MSSASSDTVSPLPLPNGMSASPLPAPMGFWASVDAEIARIKGPRAPSALWPDELLPAYAMGMGPELAAARIIARRDVRSMGGNPRRRRRGPLKVVLDAWREWRFRRDLRRAGRA